MPELDDALTLLQQAAPGNPAAGLTKAYPKSDGYLYTLQSDGTERRLAPQLLATATKTASYTAAAGDQVPLDTTSGTPIVVTLPTAPADGTVIEAGWILGGNATATIVTGGSDTFQGGGTTATLVNLYQFRQFTYRASGSLWLVQNSMPVSALDARYSPLAKRVTSITSSATPTFNTDTCDIVNITALAAAITSMVTNKTGTPTDGQKLEFRILDNGTARAITWGADYITQCSFALPTTTVLSKKLRCGFEWDPAVSKWALIALSQET